MLIGIFFSTSLYSWTQAPGPLPSFFFHLMTCVLGHKSSAQAAASSTGTPAVAFSVPLQTETRVYLLVIGVCMPAACLSSSLPECQKRSSSESKKHQAPPWQYFHFIVVATYIPGIICGLTLALCGRHRMSWLSSSSWSMSSCFIWPWAIPCRSLLSLFLDEDETVGIIPDPSTALGISSSG